MGGDKNDETDQLDAWRKKRAERLKRQQVEAEEAADLLSRGSSSNNSNNNIANETDRERTGHDQEGEDDDEGTAATANKRRRMEQQEILNQQPSAFGRRKHVWEQLRGEDPSERHQRQQHQDESQILPTPVQGGGGSGRFDGPSTDPSMGNNSNNMMPPVVQPVEPSLFEKAAALHETMTTGERAEAHRLAEETRILKEASKVQTNALQGVKDLAEGVTYDTPMPTTWTIPRAILKQDWEKIRDEWHMLVQGEDVPPPLTRFVDMKLPPSIVDHLRNKKGIKKPTPIQIQGLPVALAGRDMVGIAFTGSGKTLTFSLPLALLAASEEVRMPLIANEGPLGILLAPSRELARQTFELVQELCEAFQPGLLRSQLLIGGESVRDQLELVRRAGVHCVVATPGRLRDVLKRRAMNLSLCRYICLDEADRMLDMGFDEEVGEIMNFFPKQRQTLLFSATFPQKFQDFAKTTLVKPIVVNVGRAGAANLDVIQEVEYVKDEAKVVYLLHCLQKTAPPVIIFTERKGAADDIHEYLLLKGVDAVSIHGGKDQEERNDAIRLFKAGKKDVLIATDIAAKGMDFPAIQHVINFDMPGEIEQYVHRIGRTGRAGKTGVATTFINKSCEETTLLDLKALLKEAKQRIPPVLEMLEDPRDQNGGKGCAFCGGLGHTVVNCPKIDKDARRVAGDRRDVISGGDW
jgi:ATP-dependent RNA helicase DDX41